MTIEALELILAKAPAEIVADLQETSFPDLPTWADLEEQYEPSAHAIMDTTQYPEKLDENNVDSFKRTAFALQKLMVRRVAQSMFSNPVKRKYNYDVENETEQAAVDIIEEMYRTRSFIDSENIKRAKMLNATCQVATIWSAYEVAPYFVKGEPIKYKLFHKSYSEQQGYKLYPIVDRYDNLLVFSVYYTDSDDIEQMDVYINAYNGGKAQYLRFVNLEGWQLDAELSNTALEVFPVVYANIDAPVWGGDDGTLLVEQLESMESYQGLYIQRNALPTFTLDYGEIEHGSQRSTTEEKADDSRRIIEVGKGGQMNDVTWQGAGDAVSDRFTRIRNAFFEQNQVPDTSFSTMIASNTSADNKELIFADAKANAQDLGGVWVRFFYDEFEIIKTYLSVLFPKYRQAFQNISARSVITPYSIKTRAENAEYVSTAGDSMSLETKVGILGESDDVTAEADRIRAEQQINTNSGIL